jgi:signal transduction histidine kinase
MKARYGDVLLAIVGTLAVVVEALFRAPPGVSPLAYSLALLAGAPLAVRTRAPLAALVAVVAGAVVNATVLHASWTVTIILMIELYTIALLGDRLRSLIIGALTAGGVLLTILVVDGSIDPQGVGSRLPLVVLSLAIGDTVRSRQALRAAARERAEREAREQEEEARRRAAAERLQIARELHDTLGHSLVAINVRASVAVHLANSQDSTAALADIKQASAGALRDLRVTLTLLRDQNDGAPTAPVLDLAALPGLARHARSAGLDAEVDVDVGATPVPSAISGAAFRIVQEALTNVLRHADASCAHVRVRARSDALDVEVTDDGRPTSLATDPGFGLRGMAERTTALGGRLEAGPRAEGGWRVHAVLPLAGGGVQ